MILWICLCQQFCYRLQLLLCIPGGNSINSADFASERLRLFFVIDPVVIAGMLRLKPPDSFEQNLNFTLQDTEAAGARLPRPISLFVLFYDCGLLTQISFRLPELPIYLSSLKY